jgi:hypothetical protein
MDKQELVQMVLEEIKKDLLEGDIERIERLLLDLSYRHLERYVPEDEWDVVISQISPDDYEIEDLRIAMKSFSAGEEGAIIEKENQDDSRFIKELANVLGIRAISPSLKRAA